MSLTTVIAALNSYIQQDGTIDLYAASGDQELDALRPMLARFTITSSFVLTAARLAPGATSAKLTGFGSWGLPGAPPANVVAVAAVLDCVQLGAADVGFTLTFTVTQAGWTFGTTFAGLPDTTVSVARILKQQPSFMNGLRLDNAAFQATSATTKGLTLAGSLPLGPFWSRWQSLIGPWPLQLRGAVVAPSTYDGIPVMDLLATAAGASIPLQNPLLDLGPLSLTDMGFGLISEPGDNQSDPTDGAFTVLNLTGRLQVGGLVARLSCAILSSTKTWHFIVEFEDGSLVEGMNQLAKLFGVPSLPTPPSFLPIPYFRFGSIEFYVRPGKSLTDFEVTYIAATIQSTQSWTSPAPFIKVEDVGISWLWGQTPLKGKDIGWFSASVFGTLAFGTEDTFHIDCSVAIPTWSATANLRAGDVIPITAAFRNYFGSTGPPTPSDMNVVGLTIDANPQQQSYYANADIYFGTPPSPERWLERGAVPARKDLPKQGWTIDLGVFQLTLRQLTFEVSVVGGEVTGGIGAVFLFPGGSLTATPPAFMMSAQYPSQSGAMPPGWVFSGNLLPGAALSLTAMVADFLGQTTVPSWVPNLSVDRLYFRLNTGSPEYAFGGTVSVAWTPQIFGTTLKVSAAASVDMAKRASDADASGKVEGLFSINRLTLTAGLTLGVPEPTYQFRVQFDEIWFQAFTSWRGENESRHQIISLQLGGVTIGQMLEYLVNLAAPTLGYSLDPPWDILNSIELSRFTLTLDPGGVPGQPDSSVELVYAADADLVFMKLDTIGIRYTRGAKSGVSLILTGSLLGQRYDGDDLSWDVIDGSPPALPGGGETFIRLRYLGLGQRVQLTSLPDTVAETLALLTAELKEPQPGQNPMEGQGVVWSPVSQWLIGADITLLDTVDIGFVFNDPWLYGLSIALGGKEAGSLSGLRFEILYKKISDSVGMFRIELTLPEAYRTFEFGEVSVTLGVVVIEIYTNGNFKIDLGFPYNRNFERSFTVQVFPFLGRGGIYFGLLNGTTSRSVPRITNGDFSPVIELGVGLAVGVGKEIHVGPLSGGIYVELEVLFQGVLGWFHPSAAGCDTATYYWAQGVAAIHGKLYGAVDFKVIKVSVTLDAYAAATVTLEAYRPTEFRLEVSVSAQAEVKVLFIKIKFSFHVGLDVSFEVGQMRPTPWILATDQSPSFPLHSSQAVLRLNRPSRMSRGATRRPVQGPRRRPARRRKVLLEAHLATLGARSLDDAVVTLNWQPTKTVFGDSPRTAGVYFLPAFSVGDVPLSWTATPPTNASPEYRFAMQLFAPTGSDPDALTAKAVKRRSAALSAQARDEGDLDALAATTLIEALLLYAVYAIPGGPQAPTGSVTAGELTLLAGLLDDPAATASGFTRDALSTFFSTNVHLAISGIPENYDDATDTSSMAVAVPPFLSWTSPQTGAVDFAADNQIGPLYIWGVQAQAALFSPSGQVPPGPPDDPLSDYQSFASHVFADWCLLIAKSAVRDALAALDNRALAPATSDDTLTTIANAQPQATIPYPVRPGDTVETVADAVGATVDELVFLNPGLADALADAAPGSSVTIVLGISPEVLASDNPDAALQVKSLPLGDLTIPVTATDTLNALGTRYGTTAAAILAVPLQDLDAKLLAAGALFDAPATTWTAAPTGFTALTAAAAFYVRYTGGILPSDVGGAAAGWYAQALAQINMTLLQGIATDVLSTELPPGTVLAIPSAYQDATPVADGYTSVPGDTLVRIGAALNLVQNHASDLEDPSWSAFRDGVGVVTGGFSIPAFTGVAIAPAETTAMLARRTIVNWVSNGAVPPVWSASWTGLAAWIGVATILAPLTLITIPGVTTDSTTDYTFASLATAYGLALTAVGTKLAGVKGLVAGESLTVKHLPADTIQSLTDIIGADSIAGIAGEASRFLFSGQDIPVPIPDPDQQGHVMASPDTVSPLFDQSRQQWTIPVDAGDPTGVALSLVLSTQVDWIALSDSTVVGQGEDLAALRARVPGAFAAGRNRALDAGRMPPAGAILRTEDAETLSYSVTNAEVLAQVPATALAWPPYKKPEAVNVRGEAPVAYELPQHIALQTAVPLPVPGFDVTKNTLSIHPFAPSLIARAQAGTDIAYGVLESVSGTADSAPVANTTFACMIAFTVRRIAEAPGVYQLLGAKTEQLDQLVALIEYLATTGIPTGTVARIALPPATDAADPSGLALVDGDAWLIKSNLSTETVPPNNAALAEGDPAPPLCRAGLDDPKNFALLLWEGTSVGGFGYSFGVDGGIGAGAFDAADMATLDLLVILGAQQAAAPDGRTLLAANNVALAVDQGIADGATLFAQAVDTDDPLEFVVQALLPAGSAGFDLAFTRPVVSDGDGGMNALRQTYSLVTAAAATQSGAVYSIPPSGLPATPEAWDGQTAPAWERARAKRAAADDPDPLPYWAYQTVLPVYRFAQVASAAPAVDGLPPPASDPYRGLGTQSQAPQVLFSIGVGDVLGNRNLPADNTSLPVTVGYTDPLDGPAGWPSVNSYYLVTGSGSDVALGITLAAKAQALMPTTDQRGDAMVLAAGRQAELYASIYYQYVQPGLTVTAETTLQTGTALTLQGASALVPFAMGGYLTATGATLYGAVNPAAAALGTIVSSYGIGWQALATVNAAVPLSQIFGADVALTVPAYAVMATGDTADSIAAVTRTGWPAPTASEILGFTQNKSDLPLHVGAVLSYPARAVTIADPAPTLAVAAAAAATTAAWLANDSTADAILADGFVFVVDDVSVIVGTTPIPGEDGMVATFADAAAAFVDAGIGISAATLGDLYAEIPDMLIAGATAHTAHYVVAGEATLTSNPSGAATTDLIADNLDTPDLFDAGALVYLGDFGTGDPPTVTPGAGETVAGFAGRYGCPPAALLGANATLSVVAGTALAIPGAIVLPASSAISVPYTLRTGDILSTVAAGFDLTPNPDKLTALAILNADMPGTVAQGQTFVVNVDGTDVTVDTTGLTSFAAVLADVQETAPTATMADVAPAFDTAGRLAAGGLLVCPPAILAAATKPKDVQTPYGIGATAFALANAGVPDLVLPDVTLTAPDPAIGTVTTAARDTLNSVVGRFNDLYLAAGKPATATVANVVDTNRDAVLFASGARALLPPADIALTTPLAATGPYPGCAFALTVELVVTRPHDLVFPGFQGTSAEAARATIAAPAGSVSVDGSLTFDDFSQAFLTALRDLRLATAKAQDQAADLWAVNFETSGITSVTVEPTVTFGQAKQARMIALAPLYGVLVSRAQVPIEPLVGGSLDPAQSVLQDYQGIDVEVWASRFIGDFERLLEPAPAAAIDAIVALRPQFVRMMTVKQTLQSAIPIDLKGVFRTKSTADGGDARAVYDPNLAAGLTEARSVLGQALGVSLSSAWSTAAIVQYDGSVDSCWTRTLNPLNPPSGAALYGQVRSADASQGDDPENPSWRLAAAKVSLSDAAPFLTLPLSVTTPGTQSALALDLAYVVMNTEINRVPETVAPGYTRSDWLAMTPVLDAAADTMPTALDFQLGATAVPIPLKAFPALPLILSQTGSGDPSATLDTAALWSFDLVYSHKHAAQDHVLVTVETNLRPPLKAKRAETPDQDLFTALAQYIAVADDLNGLLAGLTDASRGISESTLEAAVTTFADLATDIADLWTTRLPNQPDDPEDGDDWIPTEIYPLSAAVNYSGTWVVESYTLTRLDGGIGTALAWPEVACQLPGGSWVTLDAAAPVGDTRIYTPPTGVTLLGPWPRLSLAWPGLNVGATQNARATLEVVRNADLLGESGPATADEFIYRTALVTGTDIVTPAISRTDAYAMTGATLEAALQAAFDTLFPPAERPAELRLTFGLFYGYTLVPGPQPLVSEIAVGLIPDQALDDTTAAMVAGALESWQQQVKPNTDDGSWVISLMLYSYFDPGKRVLLSLDRLTYPLTQD